MTYSETIVAMMTFLHKTSNKVSKKLENAGQITGIFGLSIFTKESILDHVGVDYCTQNVSRENLTEECEHVLTRV